ncbi:MAG: hypothetical protein HYU46_01210, partial [Deltaproteobacteria bacterium]|nr:hypothetical protein [Deltaproteobacteria bacterium]
EDEIRKAVVGHLCRCTGYVQIVEAILGAASEMAAEGRARASITVTTR